MSETELLGKLVESGGAVAAALLWIGWRSVKRVDLLIERYLASKKADREAQKNLAAAVENLTGAINNKAANVAA